MDVKYIKRKSLGKRNMWILVEEQYSTMKWSFFGRRENEVITHVHDYIIRLKATNLNLTKYLRKDNSGGILV
jgi:hypothetical protein